MDIKVDENYSFRFATNSDLDLIIDFISKLAKDKNKLDILDIDRQTLKYWLFDRNLVNVFFLTINNKEIGFAIYFFNFSLYKGKSGIFLEDIYITDEYKHKDYDKIMFKKLCQIALRNNVDTIEWTCFAGDEDCINFFDLIGAKEISREKIYKLDGDKIEKLVN